MMATSHAVSGAVIALAIREPVLALPLAFVSHFVLDSLPHIGLDEYGGHSKKPALFLKILIIDSLLLTGLMIFLIMQSAPIIVFGCLIFGRTVTPFRKSLVRLKNVGKVVLASSIAKFSGLKHYGEVFLKFPLHY
jgi:hypothetical protein